MIRCCGDGLVVGVGASTEDGPRQTGSSAERRGRKDGVSRLVPRCRIWEGHCRVLSWEGGGRQQICPSVCPGMRLGPFWGKGGWGRRTGGPSRRAMGICASSIRCCALGCTRGLCAFAWRARLSVGCVAPGLQGRLLLLLAESARREAGEAGEASEGCEGGRRGAGAGRVSFRCWVPVPEAATETMFAAVTIFVAGRWKVERGRWRCVGLSPPALPRAGGGALYRGLPGIPGAASHGGSGLERARARARCTWPRRPTASTDLGYRAHLQAALCTLPHPTAPRPLAAANPRPLPAPGQPERPPCACGSPHGRPREPPRRRQASRG